MKVPAFPCLPIQTEERLYRKGSHNRTDSKAYQGPRGQTPRLGLHRQVHHQPLLAQRHSPRHRRHQHPHKQTQHPAETARQAEHRRRLRMQANRTPRPSALQAMWHHLMSASPETRHLTSQQSQPEAAAIPPRPRARGTLPPKHAKYRQRTMPPTRPTEKGQQHTPCGQMNDHPMCASNRHLSLPSCIDLQDLCCNAGLTGFRSYFAKSLPTPEMLS